MKIKDKYKNLKYENPDSLVLIKSGNFYSTFNDDAYIINLMLNYRVINDKVGFPIKVIDYVIKELNNNIINYVIFNNENEMIIKNFDENNYLCILESCKKMEFRNSMKKLLIDRIEFLIDLSNENYEKIRRFIDEL